ncbi:MAG: acyl carrier protein [Bacillota bacterium]
MGMEEKIKEIMSGLFRVNVSEINEESTMKTVARWDSLKHIQLMVAIEESFDIPKLKMEEIVKMTSFSSIISILKEKLKEKS